MNPLARRNALALAVLAAASATAANAQPSYERCLQLAQIYRDLADVRDSGTTRDVARTALLTDRDAVRQIGGPRTVDLLIETVYGHPELASNDFEAVARLECVRRAIR